MAYRFECIYGDCDFAVHANDEDGVVEAVREHATNRHATSMDRAEIERGMRRT